MPYDQSSSKKIRTGGLVCFIAVAMFLVWLSLEQRGKTAALKKTEVKGIVSHLTESRYKSRSGEISEGCVITIVTHRAMVDDLAGTQYYYLNTNYRIEINVGDSIYKPANSEDSQQYKKMGDSFVFQQVLKKVL